MSGFNSNTGRYGVSSISIGSSGAAPLSTGLLSEDRLGYMSSPMSPGAGEVAMPLSSGGLGLQADSSPGAAGGKHGVAAPVVTGPSKHPRLVSLDCFRGLVIAWMIFADEIGVAWNNSWDHAPWDGLHFADFVFPSFVFIIGLAVPLSLPARKLQTVKDKLLASRKALWRCFKMFLVGWICASGGFPGHYRLAITRIPGILQRLAFVYLVLVLIHVWVPLVKNAPVEGSEEAEEEDSDDEEEEEEARKRSSAAAGAAAAGAGASGATMAYMTRVSHFSPVASSPSEGGYASVSGGGDIGSALDDGEAGRRRWKRIVRGLRLYRRYAWQWLVAFLFAGLWLGLTFGTRVPGCESNGHSALTPWCSAAKYWDNKLIGSAHMYSHPTYQRSHWCSSNAPGDFPRTDAPAWCAEPFDPEGILGTFTSVVSGFFGLWFGHVLSNVQRPRRRLAHWLSLSVVSLGIGLALHFGDAMPINKNLWSLSYVLVMAGVDGFVFSIFYYVVDVRQWGRERLLYPLIAMGMNAILVFVTAQTSISLDTAIKWVYLDDPTQNLWYWYRFTFLQPRCGTSWAYFTWSATKVVAWLAISVVLAKKKIFWKL